MPPGNRTSTSSCPAIIGRPLRLFPPGRHSHCVQLPTDVSDELRRQVERRSAGFVSDVERLRFVRESIAKHETALRRRARFLRRSMEVYRASRRRVRLALCIPLTALLFAIASAPNARRIPQNPLPARIRASAEIAAPKVWLVERNGGIEIYSNGLRVDNEFLTTTRTRVYRTFDRQSLRASSPETRPAGIVFHTTESRMAPFERSQNARLQYNGRNLLAYIARNRLYHFVIDRFGRAFRVVAETDYANHAGRSLWADDQHIYWSLNQSFLGVAFEVRTDAARNIATQAQIDAARVLTEMLRSRYPIPVADCLTHAQVSVNLQTVRLGYHTDWAANFPFPEVGLGNGYNTPVAALTLFGFDYDSTFLEANGGRVWPGLVVAEEQLVQEAAAHATTLELYRRKLRQRFRDWKPDVAYASADDASGDR